MIIPEGAYCHVVLWVGETFFSRCVADVFDGDVLTVTRLDDDAVAQEIPAGDWRTATVYTDHGPLYCHTAKTPTRRLETMQ